MAPGAWPRAAFWMMAVWNIISLVPESHCGPDVPSQQRGKGHGTVMCRKAKRRLVAGSARGSRVTKGWLGRRAVGDTLLPLAVWSFGCWISRRPLCQGEYNVDTRTHHHQQLIPPSACCSGTVPRCKATPAVVSNGCGAETRCVCVSAWLQGISGISVYLIVSDHHHFMPEKGLR